MERPSRFLQSLLVLHLIIEVIFACECKPITLEQAMCQSQTVILARVVSEELLDQEGFVTFTESDAKGTRYKLHVQRVFQDRGTNKLSLKNTYGCMAFPRHNSDCGGVLHEGVDYVITGSVDARGELYSSICHHIVQYEYIVHDRHKMNILQGDADCANV